MSTETLAPDALLSSSGFTGTPAITDIDEDPDSPDAAWFVATGFNVNTDAHCSFPTPTDDLTIGADLQEFRALFRRTPGATTDSNAHIELWENGSLVRAGSNTLITSDTGQVVSFTWNASELSGISGSLVEVKLFGHRSSVGAVDFGAVEWNADYTIVTEATLAVTLDDATIAAAGAVDVDATSAVTLGDATLAAATDVLVDATLAATLDGATAAGAGTVDVDATLAGTLDGATAAGVGTVDVDATLAGTLDGATLAATGAVDVAGIGAPTLGDAMLAAAGTVDVDATSAVALGDATLAAYLVDGEVSGIGAATLDDATIRSLASDVHGLPYVGIVRIPPVSDSPPATPTGVTVAIVRV